MEAEFKDQTHEYLISSVKCKEFTDQYSEKAAEEKCQLLLRNLTAPPLYTVLRVNTWKYDIREVEDLLKEEIKKQYEKKTNLQVPTVIRHPVIDDVLIIPSIGPIEQPKQSCEVIVDLACGMAVLRGADVFAQGIMAAPIEMEVNHFVSVYTDIEGTCRKGLTKQFDGKKIHVGNGVARLSRTQLFVDKAKAQGVGIEITHPLYSGICVHGLLPDRLFAQNLPSVVCSHVLDPQPGETILDMCAAPGGKTCHIATKMKNIGRIVAFDKSPKKIERIMENARRWSLDIIEAYQQDGCKSLDEQAGSAGPPPYSSQSFDRILLDAPCSALGQRPCVYNKMSLKEVKSFPILQKKLFETAYELLKCGGTLVYSTCSIPLEENEGLVHWAMKKFPKLTLSKQTPHIGQEGWLGSGLTDDQRKLVQRFDPSNGLEKGPDTDTIGFFIAKFNKS